MSQLEDFRRPTSNSIILNHSAAREEEGDLLWLVFAVKVGVLTLQPP